jgi:hypothetical protein
MPNYQDAKIYKLYSILPDGTNINYYGATTKDLRVRLSDHIYDYKRNRSITSKHIIEAGNYNIMLIESYPCCTKEELSTREQFYILNNDCVNKVIPLRTQAQYRNQHADIIREYNKNYRNQNADKLKNYRDQHADKYKEYYKNYRDQHADRYKEYQKNYRNQYADKYKEYRKNYRDQNADKYKE